MQKSTKVPTLTSERFFFLHNYFEQIRFQGFKLIIIPVRKKYKWKKTYVPYLFLMWNLIKAFIAFGKIWATS